MALPSPGCARSTRPSQSAIGPWDWGFHTVPDGVDPGELGFCPRGVGVVEIWKDVCNGNGAQSSPGAARLARGCREGQLAPRSPRSMFGRGRMGGKPSAKEIGARKTQGSKPNAYCIISPPKENLYSCYEIQQLIIEKDTSTTINIKT